MREVAAVEQSQRWMRTCFLGSRPRLTFLVAQGWGRRSLVRVESTCKRSLFIEARSPAGTDTETAWPSSLGVVSGSALRAPLGVDAASSTGLPLGSRLPRSPPGSQHCRLALESLTHLAHWPARAPVTAAARLSLSPDGSSSTLTT